MLIENKGNDKRIKKKSYDARCIIITACFMLPAEIFYSVLDLSALVTLYYHLVWWLGDALWIRCIPGFSCLRLVILKENDI